MSSTKLSGYKYEIPGHSQCPAPNGLICSRCWTVDDESMFFSVFLVNGELERQKADICGDCYEFLDSQGDIV